MTSSRSSSASRQWITNGFLRATASCSCLSNTCKETKSDIGPSVALPSPYCFQLAAFIYLKGRVTEGDREGDREKLRKVFHTLIPSLEMVTTPGLARWGPGAWNSSWPDL